MNPLLQQLRNSPLSANVGSLFVIQLLNYLIPVIVIPILTHKLGDGNYGIIAFAQYFSGIMIFLCDYGFVYTGPQQVSQNQQNHGYLNSLFCSITTIRTIFFLFSIIITAVFCFSINFSSDEIQAIFISLLSVAGNLLTPLWFLQGYQKLRALAIINIVFKILQLVLIIVLIQLKTDLVLACLIIFGTNFLLGLVTFVYTLIKFKIKWTTPTMPVIKEQLRLGYHMFLAVFFSSAYIHGTGIILGLVTNNNQIVGHFSAAEKIVRAVTYMFNPLVMAFFPFISKMFVINRDMALQVFFRFLKLIILVTAFTAVILALTADFAVNLLLDESFANSSWLIIILSPIIVFGNVGNMLGNNLFIQLGWQKVTVMVVLILATINTAVCIALSHYYQATGASIALVSTEIISPVLFYFYYTQKKNTL